MIDELSEIRETVLLDEHRERASCGTSRKHEAQRGHLIDPTREELWIL